MSESSEYYGIDEKSNVITKGGGNYTFYFGKKYKRSVLIRVGSRYLINPLNPQKKKNKGRVCELIAFDEFYQVAHVKFVDTKRSAKVDPSDLVEMPPGAENN